MSKPKFSYILSLLLLVAVLFALVPLLPAHADPDPGWYDPSWKYRKKITIDHTKVPNTNQSYFPVLINITDTDWKDTANGGHVGQSDGGDILFTSSDGTSKLDHEIERYTPSTGELIAWVEVPTLLLIPKFISITAMPMLLTNGILREPGTREVITTSKGFGI